MGFLVAVLALGGDSARGAEKIDHEAQTTHKKLAWDDFRGPVVQGQQVAWIVSTIVVDPWRTEIGETGSERTARVAFTDVYALMDKLNSGARRGARDDYKLAHEQAHFDITEIHARRLHRRVSDLVVTAEPGTTDTLLEVQLGQDVQLLWEAGMNAMKEHQALYDDETHHGLKKKQQKKWLERIAGELASEEPYPLR